MCDVHVPEVSTANEARGVNAKMASQNMIVIFVTAAFCPRASSFLISAVADRLKQHNHKQFHAVQPITTHTHTHTARTQKMAVQQSRAFDALFGE